MKLVVRNPSLPVLVGSILLGVSVRKPEARSRAWRADHTPPALPIAEIPAEAPPGLVHRLRGAWALWREHRKPAGLGL